MEQSKRVSDVVDRLQEMFGEGVRFSVQPVIRTNEVLTGISLSLPGVTCLPTMFPDRFPETMTAEVVASRMAADFQRVLRAWSEGNAVQLPALSRDYLLEHVYIQALGAERNQVIARNYLTLPLMDLIGVLRVAVPPWKRGRLNSTLIQPAVLKCFHVTLEDLALAALENTPRLFGVDLLDIKRDQFYLMDDPEWSPGPFEDVRMDPRRVYVLTNSIHVSGAGLLFSPDTLAAIGEKLESDYIILPSSIHELQIQPEAIAAPVEKLRADIRAGNRNPRAVPPEDVLTDSVYRWRWKTRTLEYA